MRIVIIVTILLISCLGIVPARNVESAVSPDRSFELIQVGNEDGSLSVIVTKKATRDVASIIANRVSKLTYRASWNKDSNLLIIDMYYGTKGRDFSMLKLSNGRFERYEIIDSKESVLGVISRECYFDGWVTNDSFAVIEIDGSKIYNYEYKSNGDRITLLKRNIERASAEVVKDRIAKAMLK
jgi:hypothetical protein